MAKAQDRPDQDGTLHVQLTTRTPKSSCADMLRGQRDILLIFLAVVVGLGIAFGLQSLDLSDDVIQWIGLPGELYLRSLKTLIVPLIACVMFNTASSLSPKVNGRIALIAIAIFFLLCVITSVLAMCLFLAFRPDTRDAVKRTSIRAPLKTSDVFLDLFRNVFPDNLVAATFSQTVTAYEPKTIHVEDSNATSDNDTRRVEVMVRTLRKTGGANTLGLLTISTALGIADQMVLPSTSTLRAICRDTQAVVVIVISWVIKTTPLAVLSMIVGSLAKVKDIWHTFEIMGVLISSVTVGLALHTLVIMPALLFLVTRRNPYKVIAQSARVVAIAFASTSSSVTLPVMLTTCHKLGVQSTVSHVVLSLAISVHRSGSCLYIGFCALFIGQLTGSLDNMGTIFIVGTLSTFMSMVIPPIPSSSVMTLILILTTLNIPLQDIAFLFGLEWFLDRLRTITNCIGHVMITLVIDTICLRYVQTDDVNNGREEGQGHRTVAAAADDNSEEETPMVVPNCV